MCQILNGTALSIKNFVVHYTDLYTGATAATDTAGASHTVYEYDRFGNVIKTTDPLGQVETSAYDSNGLLLSKIERNGNTTAYTYDAMGRLLTATVKNSEGTTLDTTTNTYTTAGYKHSESGDGVTATYAYDAIGRMTGANETGNIAKTYAYDLAGNRTGFLLKQGSTVLQNLSYTYDNANRLTGVLKDGTSVAAYARRFQH